MLPGTVTSDSDLMAELIASELAQHPETSDDGRALERALLAVLPRLKGAFSLVLMDEDHVIGVRDPNGFRPLCLGKLDARLGARLGEPRRSTSSAPTSSASSSPARWSSSTPTACRSVRPFADRGGRPQALPVRVRLLRPPRHPLYGQSVHQARVRMGEQLAEQAPADADLVMGVPESGLPAAEGFARASGIPYGQGLVKNRYIGRTFIAPNQEMRALGVRMKLNPLRENIAGKRLVVVDDSIVRGTTTRAMVAMLREAGAAEVHLRVSSPPVPVAVLLRHGHRRPRRAARRQPGASRRSASTSTSTRSPTSPSTGCSTATGAVGAGLLRRLPHRRLPRGGAGRASPRACSRCRSPPRPRRSAPPPSPGCSTARPPCPPTTPATAPTRPTPPVTVVHDGTGGLGQDHLGG